MNISRAVKTRIQKTEQAIRGLPYEEFIVFSPEGKKVLRRKGTHNEVRLSNFDCIKLLFRMLFKKKNIATHNHPNDNPFSFIDIKSAFNMNLMEDRVITSSGRVHVMELPKNISFKTAKRAEALLLHINKRLGESRGNNDYTKRHYRIMRKAFEKNFPGIKFRTLV